MPVLSELNRRVAPHVVRGNGAESVFLARQPWRWGHLLNAPEIEAVAHEHGFTVVYPDELTFVEQVNLLANAKRVLATEGSALFLCYFASPGTRLLILENAAIEGANVYRALFPNCEPTAMAGTIVDRDHSFPHRSSFRLDPQRFRDVLTEWQ